ncbi:hypothetical protein C7212DRAFT_346057 [Tuber magnatum]|uniref:Uncharacterized protein n=1 Tax=Tuber magnatum TaxID=42249 RepID=A0A317SLL6_9PEZI|nr:hypothetical protein C7212DRAFT_346057 [Tuber magnatum]
MATAEAARPRTVEAQSQAPEQNRRNRGRGPQHGDTNPDSRSDQASDDLDNGSSEAGAPTSDNEAPARWRTQRDRRRRRGKRGVRDNLPFVGETDDDYDEQEQQRGQQLQHQRQQQPQQQAQPSGGGGRDKPLELRSELLTSKSRLSSRPRFTVIWGCRYFRENFVLEALWPIGL